MAHQPVGDSQTLTTGTSSTRVQFTVQSDTLRVVPVSQNVHVAIGTTATATTSDYFVPAGTSATLNLGKVPKEPDIKTDSTDDPESPGTPNLKGGEI